MTLIVQIVLLLALLVGLVTIIMSSKTWHWTQLVLVLFVFFAATGFMFLGAETLRIHKNLRSGIAKREDDIARLKKQNEELLRGVGDQPGIETLDHRLQIITRERGRVWRGVVPAGQVDQQGVVPVNIAQPTPHGLEQGAILYAFEAGNPNTTNPDEGAQYLGEFRVTEAIPGGATLEPVLLIDNRTGERLASSQGPWSLYETMPIDRHQLFSGFNEEQLRGMLPPQSVDEYLRHGTEATPDDDQWHVTGLDENGERVGPEQMSDAVKRLYDRTLRDYAFIFNELNGVKVVALARQQAVREDNAKLVAALESAEETSNFRKRQISELDQDLAGMKQDLAAITAHRDAVLNLLGHFQERIEGYVAANSAFASDLAQRQLGMVNYLDSVAPAPGSSTLLNR